MCRVFLNLQLTELSMGNRETLHTSKLIKTVIPSETQELIKQIKLNSYVWRKDHDFKFNLIMSGGGASNDDESGITYRIKLITQSYDVFRLWIIGLNRLISCK